MLDILKELQVIFREYFDDENLVLTISTRQEDIEDWDSLAQMNLIAAIEERFKVKFRVSEFAELKNVGEMVEVIKSRI